jgi:signal transduction histidine kinase
MNVNPRPNNNLKIPAPPKPAAIISLTLARVLGALVGLAGLVSFLGWALNIDRLTDWEGNGISIQPNNTVCMMLGGAAVIFLASGREKIGAWLGMAAGAIGAATLSQWLFHIDLGIDELLMFGRTWGRVGVIWPGRMGPPAAFSWTLLLCGFLLLAGGRRRTLVPVFPLAVLFIASISFIGYLLGADMLFTVPRLTVIAWQTSGMFILLSLGLLAAMPDLKPFCLFLNEGVIGLLLRRLVIPIVALPMLVRAMRVAGQNIGLFDDALGSALAIVILITALLGGLLLIGNQALNFERDAQEGEEAKRRVTLLSRMMTAQENERRLIASELHDGLGQYMTALRFQVNALRDESDADARKSKVQLLAETAAAIDTGLTDIVLTFRPRSLDMLGLSEALDHHVRAWGRMTAIPAKFESHGYRRGMISVEAETGLFRIAQEALNNCAKHSGAKSVTVLLTATRGVITLVIEDDGCGFDQADKRDGLGLTSMRERAELAGGKLEIESTRNGSTIHVVVPMQDPDPKIHETA